MVWWKKKLVIYWKDGSLTTICKRILCGHDTTRLTRGNIAHKRKPQENLNSVERMSSYMKLNCGFYV